MAHRILVVDHEPVVRALISRVLTDDGFVDDVSRRGRVKSLPSDVPTIYKPFSIAALRAAVRGLLAW